MLGLVSALMGRMFGAVGSFWKYLVAGVCLVMGLQLLGLFTSNFPVPKGLTVRTRGTSSTGAFFFSSMPWATRRSS